MERASTLSHAQIEVLKINHIRALLSSNILMLDDVLRLADLFRYDKERWMNLKPSYAPDLLRQEIISAEDILLLSEEEKGILASRHIRELIMNRQLSLARAFTLPCIKLQALQSDFILKMISRNRLTVEQVLTWSLKEQQKLNDVNIQQLISDGEITIEKVFASDDACYQKWKTPARRNFERKAFYKTLKLFC